MNEKSVIIIGAGIAGLAAGCYARMNGYKTTILEQHDKPGGLCTAWQRNGYTVDGLYSLAGRFEARVGIVPGLGRAGRGAGPGVLLRRPVPAVRSKRWPGIHAVRRHLPPGAAHA